ncbi:MAG: hypothetical protein FD126_434 [Elusimicrobia bacterium]|nr:MAG: hypothetical protein FD126_434 [Elusimicrobiota bacterium]
MDPTLVWVLTAVLALAGAAGVFLPLLPGPPLILAAAVFNKVMLPAALSWWTVGLLSVLCLMAEGVQLALTLGGAKGLGASKWGMGGAVVGAFLGFFGGVWGMFLGAAVGALVAESAFAGRPLDQAAKAALGAALGLAASMAGRVAIALTMLVILIADAILI